MSCVSFIFSTISFLWYADGYLQWYWWAETTLRHPRESLLTWGLYSSNHSLTVVGKQEGKYRIHKQWFHNHPMMQCIQKAPGGSLVDAFSCVSFLRFKKLDWIRTIQEICQENKGTVFLVFLLNPQAIFVSNHLEHGMPSAHSWREVLVSTSRGDRKYLINHSQPRVCLNSHNRNWIPHAGYSQTPGHWWGDNAFPPHQSPSFYKCAWKRGNMQGLAKFA